MSLFLCVQPFQLGKPEIKKITNCWGNVTPSVTEIVSEIVVYNPKPIPLPLKDILAEIYMNDIKMGEGKVLNPTMPSGEHKLIVLTKLENDKIPEWFMTHVKNNKNTKIKFMSYVIFDLIIKEFK